MGQRTFIKTRPLTLPVHNKLSFSKCYMLFNEHPRWQQTSFFKRNGNQKSFLLRNKEAKTEGIYPNDHQYGNFHPNDSQWFNPNRIFHLHFRRVRISLNFARKSTTKDRLSTGWKRTSVCRGETRVELAWEESRFSKRSSKTNITPLSPTTDRDSFQWLIREKTRTPVSSSSPSPSANILISNILSSEKSSKD